MQLTFPSLTTIVEKATETMLRFPMVLLFAVIGTTIAIFWTNVETEQVHNYMYLIKSIMTCSLGLVLMLSSALFSEIKQHNKSKTYGLQAIGIVMLLIYYFTLPEDANFDKKGIHHPIRFLLFNISLHMLVAFAPFAQKGGINAFWQYNKALFIRFLTAVLYSGVLYLGLVLALVSIDQLLGFHIHEKRYFNLWCLIAGVFNTWFFLAGIPRNVNDLENNNNYPAGLKVFTQFVLLPLVSVYLFILYAYMGKIIFLWELPKGWVSYLVIFFSVAGILSLLLIHPIRNNEGNNWIRIFARWFYRALYPLIILLCVAIGRRIVDYGITENRYFVLVLALWLTGIATYFLISKNKNIKVIPISLSIIAFLTSVGPWGAFSVSEKNQLARLESRLIEANILVEGKIVKAKDTSSTKQGKEIVSILDYLAEMHDLRKLQPWFDTNLDTLFEGDQYRYINESKAICAQMGIDYNKYGRFAAPGLDSTYFHLYTGKRNQPKKVTGYDYQLNAYCYGNNNVVTELCTLQIDSANYSILYHSDAGNLIGYIEQDTVFTYPFHAFVEHIREKSININSEEMPEEEMTLVVENDRIKVKIVLERIMGKMEKEGLIVTSTNGYALMRLKKDAAQH